MRGFWYMIEAVLAGIILLGFLIMLTSGYVSVPREDMSLKGYGILHELDQQGILRAYAVTGNYSGLNSRIRLFGYNHSVQICNQMGSCLGSMPNAENVWVGNYAIAGEDQYNPKLVKLYVWRL